MYYKSWQATHFQKNSSHLKKCLTERTFIHKIEGKYDLESELEIYLQLFTDWCYKRAWGLIAWSVEKKTETLISKIFKTKNGRLIMQSKLQNVKNQGLWKNKKQKVYWVI